MKVTCLAVWIAALLVLSGGAWAFDLPTTQLYSSGTGDYLTVAPSYTVSSGIYAYSYDLTNTTASDNIIGFTLVFPGIVPVTSFTDIVTPTGWTAYVRDIANKVNWQADSETYAIVPAATKTFGFSCKFGPSAAEDAVADSSRGAFGYNGTTYGPIPEPAGLAVLAVGVSGLMSFSLKRRMK
jgi:hypothetical protein